MLRSTALAALLLSAQALLAADSSMPEYVPPNTKILIGVQVRAIVDSDWGKTVIGQMKTASGGFMMQPMPLTGFDPLKDLDEVWIAGSSVESRAPMLAILHGHFDTSHLPAAIGRYHNVPLIPMDARRQQLLAVVDSSTILAGDRNGVELAIDRHGSKMTPDRDLIAAAGELRKRYWIWAEAAHLDGLSAAKGAPQGFEAVESFEFGLAMNHDLEMASQIHMRTAADAQKLLGTITMLQMMAKSQQKGQSQADIESRVTGKTLDVSLRVPEEELKQAWEQQRAAIAQTLSQLPQQIAAARPGALTPFVVSQSPSALAGRTQMRAVPASKEGKIVSDADGVTVECTLPGRR